MAYIYQCHDCGMTVTAMREDTLIDAVMRHYREQHDLKLSVEEAKRKAEGKVKTAPK